MKLTQRLKQMFAKDKRTQHLTVGQYVDVLDIFAHKETNEAYCHWRPAQVVGVTPTSVRVHFLSWDEAFDEDIAAGELDERIAPFCSCSENALSVPYVSTRQVAAASAPTSPPPLLPSPVHAPSGKVAAAAAAASASRAAGSGRPPIGPPRPASLTSAPSFSSASSLSQPSPHSSAVASPRGSMPSNGGGLGGLRPPPISTGFSTKPDPMDLFSATALGPSGAITPIRTTATMRVEVGQYIDLRVGPKKWTPACVLSTNTLREGVIGLLCQDVSDARGNTFWVPANSNAIAPFSSQVDKIQHSYTAGMFVDVLDKYVNRFTGVLTERWRGCEILQVGPTSVLVRYIGWSAAYDESINVVEQPERIREFGSKTVKESADERAARIEDEAFRAALLSQGLQVVDMDMDGNCLFRAIAHQVYNDPNVHSMLRERVCQYMEENAAYYSTLAPEAEDFDVYVSRMRLDKEWGGYPEQVAMEEIFDRPILIFDRAVFTRTRAPTPYRLTHNDSSNDESLDDIPLRLSFHGSHFNSLVDVSHPPPLSPRGTQSIRTLRLRRGRAARASIHVETEGVTYLTTSDGKVGDAVPVIPLARSLSESSQRSDTTASPMRRQASESPVIRNKAIASAQRRFAAGMSPGRSPARLSPHRTMPPSAMRAALAGERTLEVPTSPIGSPQAPGRAGADSCMSPARTLSFSTVHSPSGGAPLTPTRSAPTMIPSPRTTPKPTLRMGLRPDGSPAMTPTRSAPAMTRIPSDLSLSSLVGVPDP